MTDTDRDAAPAGVASVPTVDAATVLATRCQHGIATSAEVLCVNCMDIDPHAACRAEVVALREERDWFKGEMEQFMRGASANHARVALLEGLLRAVEWAEPNGLQHYCPICGNWSEQGHAPDCRLAAALADGG